MYLLLLLSGNVPRKSNFRQKSIIKPASSNHFPEANRAAIAYAMTALSILPFT
jgi:hypothetical protein